MEQWITLAAPLACIPTVVEGNGVHMDSNPYAMYISITAVVVSLFTLAATTYTQARIASNKTRLELYDKRFNIYLAALEYYQAIWHEPDKIKDKAIAFTKAVRESKFLFEEIDGVYEVLLKIQQNGATIRVYTAKKDTINFEANDDESVLWHKVNLKEHLAFGANLDELEKTIDKYIKFKNISGWTYR